VRTRDDGFAWEEGFAAIQEGNSWSHQAIVSMYELITRVIICAISGGGDMNNISLVDDISCQACVL
jgi:3-keto-L-gulonate-6-phosphate decarboxylase